MLLNPNLPLEWKSGKPSAPALRPITRKSKVLASVAYMAMVKHQLRRRSKGRQSNPEIAPALVLVEQQAEAAFKNWKYRRWIKQQSG